MTGMAVIPRRTAVAVISTELATFSAWRRTFIKKYKAMLSMIRKMVKTELTIINNISAAVSIALVYA
jgi:hypothetical protein